MDQAEQLNGSIPDQVAVVYSGGYDSLAAVLNVAEKASRVHLLTFKGYGVFGTRYARANTDRLRSNFPGTEFIHRIYDIKTLHRRLLEGFTEACITYEDELPSFQLWCGVCQLTLRVAALLYCLKEQITLCVDGARKDQVYYQIHTVETVNALKRLFADYGVAYRSPMYDYTGDPEVYLREQGYDIGAAAVKKSYTGTQPLCLVSLSGVCNRTYQVCHRISNDAKGAFIRSKMPRVRTIIDEYLNNNDITGEAADRRPLRDPGLLPDVEEYHRPRPAVWEIVLSTVLTPVYGLLRWMIRHVYQAGT